MTSIFMFFHVYFLYKAKESVLCVFTLIALWCSTWQVYKISNEFLRITGMDTNSIASKGV